MDNQKNTQNPGQNEDWLDSILGTQNVPKELGPDELAVSAAGLTHPDELDLERIVQETIAENWDEPQASQEPQTQDPHPVSRKAHPKKPSAETAQNSNPSAKAAGDEPKDQGEKPDLLRKLRPKMKDAYGLLGIPHILSTILWGFLILFIGISLGRLAWVCAADLLALGKDPISATITVTEDDDISDIAKKLQKAGMIRYPSLFETFAKVTGKGDDILVGSIAFDNKTVYDYNALINAMSYQGGSSVLVSIMIPEGFNCAQIFALLEEQGVCSVENLEAYTAFTCQRPVDGKDCGNCEVCKNEAQLLSDYWFLRDVPLNHKYCLEGFLFPDTYEFYMNDEPDRIIEKFLDGFNARFTQRLVDKFVALNKDLGTNFTLYEVLTIASIVEKESANPDESYNIASVFYNRMTNSGSFPFINSDATILYATQYRNKGELITKEQINSSPYNTYTNTGLPPTPISNPGLSSLDAALAPADTDYYYFIFDEDAGVHHFSRTLAEHEQWASKLGY